MKTKPESSAPSAPIDNTPLVTFAEPDVSVPVAIQFTTRDPNTGKLCRDESEFEKPASEKPLIEKPKPIETLKTTEEH